MAQVDCPTANVVTTDAGQINKAMLCLHNVVRAEHGLSRMRWNDTLGGVAAEHARDMVARHYFAHVSPGGQDHMDRLARSSYRPRYGCWSAGENLLESPGPSTPWQLLQAWMKSPPHRANVLRPGWQDFALGLVAQSPEGDRNGLTMVALYGSRTSHLCN